MFKGYLSLYLNFGNCDNWQSDSPVQGVSDAQVKTAGVEGWRQQPLLQVPYGQSDHTGLATEVLAQILHNFRTHFVFIFMHFIFHKFF